ncbi:MAG: cyclic nucleotide-binding domain-containing protein [Chitinispirillaceae bacterium]|nr:cyclic nucleotide-binding domain-containing protein [Chitinispirillaceae bacterium]
MTTDSSLSEKTGLLKRISLFEKLSDDPAALEELARLFGTVSYPQGHNVIIEGTESREDEALYVIKKGTVEIIKKTRPGDPYKVAELRAEMNIFFGELALLDQEKRSATVACKTDCEFYVLSRRDFIALGNRSPAIGLTVTREIAKIICQRLRKANNDIITLFDALVEEVAQSGGVAP